MRDQFAFTGIVRVVFVYSLRLHKSRNTGEDAEYNIGVK